MPKLARLEEFFKNTQLNFCLLKSPTNHCFETLTFNKCRNGKSLEEVERGEGKVSGRGVKS